MNAINTRKILYWGSTGIIAVAFLVTGVGNLLPFDHIAHDMSHLGYPAYFLTLLGAWKILGAVTIVFAKNPRFQEWAYAGMMFDLTGAAFSRAASGDPIPMVMVPLVGAGLVVTSWGLRPAKASTPWF